MPATSDVLRTVSAEKPFSNKMVAAASKMRLRLEKVDALLYGPIPVYALGGFTHRLPKGTGCSNETASAVEVEPTADVLLRLE